MENKILQDIKNIIGVNPDTEDDTFDNSIVIAINAAIAELAELGVGEQGDFAIERKDETWGEYLGEKYKYLLSLVKQYIGTYTKYTFDTPQSGALKAAEEEIQKRLEFRIVTTIEQHED